MVTASAAGASTAVTRAAERLRIATRDRQPCEPVRDLIDPQDIDSAYGVQRILTESRIADGAQVVGRKIGLTAEAVQRQLGVDRPDFGVLFADMECRDGGTISATRLLQPKVEAEIAFILARDLTDEHIDAATARAAVDSAVAALEIVDSRIRDWDITLADTIADNASSGMYVLGTRYAALSSFEPAEAEMTMAVDGRTVSTGTGAACLGDPLASLAWLAVTARDLGDPLRAGQVVLSGALGPMTPVQAGNHVTARISGLGSVEVRFG
jgi:2-keto-4-pentenoate hydratase